MNLNVAKAVDAFRTTYNAQMNRAAERQVFVSPNLLARDLFGERGVRELQRIDAFTAATQDFFKSFGG